MQDGSEAAWLRIFRSPVLETHYTSRGAILTHLTQILNPRIDAQVSLAPLQSLIRPLLQDWDSIHRRGHEEMALLVLASLSSDEDFLALTRKYLGEFLTRGFHHFASFQLGQLYPGAYLFSILTSDF